MTTSDFRKEVELGELITKALYQRRPETSVDVYDNTTKDLSELSNKIDSYLKDGIYIGTGHLKKAAALYGDYSVVKLLLSKQNFEQAALNEVLDKVCDGCHFLGNNVTEKEKKRYMDIAILLAINGANPDSLNIKELKWVIKDKNLAKLREAYKKYQQGLCSTTVKTLTNKLSCLLRNWVAPRIIAKYVYTTNSNFTGRKQTLKQYND